MALLVCLFEGGPKKPLLLEHLWFDLVIKTKFSQNLILQMWINTFGKVLKDKCKFSFSSLFQKYEYLLGEGIWCYTDATNPMHQIILRGFWRRWVSVLTSCVIGIILIVIWTRKVRWYWFFNSWCEHVKGLFYFVLFKTLFFFSFISYQQLLVLEIYHFAKLNFPKVLLHKVLLILV